MCVHDVFIREDTLLQPHPELSHEAHWHEKTALLRGHSVFHAERPFRYGSKPACQKWKGCLQSAGILPTSTCALLNV